jgi:hypothetical protein
MRRAKLLLLFGSIVFASPVLSAPAAQGPATNHEMTAIFDADQAARALPPDKMNWSIVEPQDAQRRARTKQLLDSGALHSADDFYHAAFVFQHGDQPNNFLIAHILAMVSMRLGRADASWIAAATLDRYLQAIGQKQVFGTQFNKMDSQAWTMEPFERALISDSLRQALAVPSIVDQEKRLREMHGSTKP